MRDWHDYPYIKVVLAFSLSPFVVAFVVGVIILGMVVGYGEHGSCCDLRSVSGLITLFQGLYSLVMVLLEISVFGGAYFFPFFILGVLFASVRMKRRVISLIAVFISGGAGTHLWAMIFFGHGALIGMAFFLGAFSSFVAAYLSFPKPKKNDCNECS